MFLRRKVSREPIAEFWAWWSTVRDEVAWAIGAGTVERFSDEFNARIAAIHPELQWELTPGVGATHALVITSAGNAELRRTAARCVSSAPLRDATWEYHPHRFGDLSLFDHKLGIGGTTLDLAGIRFELTVDEPRRAVDVRCYHPEFANLPDNVRTQITFLALDWSVGEAAVGIWIGEVGWTTTPPADPKDPRALRDAVGALTDTWTLMRATDPSGRVVLATANLPLRPARWPLYDTHVAVILPYSTRNDGGLPERMSLDALRAFEDRITASIGPDGALVAHETSDGIRQLHFYVDSDSDAAGRVKALERGWSEGRARVEAVKDEKFAGVRHLMP